MATKLQKIPPMRLIEYGDICKFHLSLWTSKLALPLQAEQSALGAHE